MPIGRRRLLLEVQENRAVADDFGEKAPAWTTVAHLYAEIDERSGTERFAGQQILATGSVLIRTGFVLWLRVTHRLKRGDAVYEINHINNVRQLNRELVLTCTQQPPEA